MVTIKSTALSRYTITRGNRRNNKVNNSSTSTNQFHAPAQHSGDQQIIFADGITRQVAIRIHHSEAAVLLTVRTIVLENLLVPEGGVADLVRGHVLLDEVADQTRKHGVKLSQLIGRLHLLHVGASVTHLDCSCDRDDRELGGGCVGWGGGGGGGFRDSRYEK